MSFGHKRFTTMKRFFLTMMLTAMLSGCGGNPAPPAPPVVTPPAGKSVEVHAPGVDVNVGKGGVDVKAPGAEVHTEKK